MRLHRRYRHVAETSVTVAGVRVRKPSATARGEVGLVPFDALTLLAQQLRDRGYPGDVFIELLRGHQVVSHRFSTPVGQAILQYMSSYVEQNRVCTRDTDLISAVTPAIGAAGIVGCTLDDGIKRLIEFMKASTGSNYVGQGVFAEDCANFLTSCVADELTFETACWPILMTRYVCLSDVERQRPTTCKSC